ncbi:ABC transporter substrate-binding protein [Bifidobacterium psychraerophilum]|jgi:polar amino acid transport system substrate-binding protein|uniref:ABC transporter substrate-binding protein n=1 Tax=Bifidobacterium psychraerophilum TaxID=218140 RepID=UPI0023EF76D3|nr:ABC transporter substrate-binding protein [Bifidobacterium psychraerophilum]MCI1805326.1 ABC transporter substrate-binding protein [Bifidobacterium psychraerophilum]MCI2176448.1 ABC transporter substrate-binding protein [Bifidobacterium psychraerophilum]
MTLGKIKGIASAMLSGALIVAMAGCGTTDSSESSASGTSGAGATPSAYDVSGISKDDAIASLVPSYIAKDGKLTVGMDTSYAPAEFLDSDGKTPIGYDVDLVNAISKVLGLTPDPQTATFDSIIPSIGTKYDIGVSSFTVTKERSEAVDFVTYFKAGMTYAVQKGNPQKVDATDLCGIKLGVQTGTTEEEEANSANKACTDKGKDAIDVQSYKQQTDVTTALVTGKVDALYADSPVTGYAIEQTGDKLQKLGEDQGVAPQAVAIKKGDSATDQAIQQAIQKLIDDGTYTKILKAWGAQSGAIEKAEINPTASE